LSFEFSKRVDRLATRHGSSIQKQKRDERLSSIAEIFVTPGPGISPIRAA